MSNGLDNIIEQIQQDAQKNAAAIKAKADGQVKLIMENAEIEGHKKSEEIIKHAEKEAENKMVLAKSNAELIIRNAVLKAKITAIDNVIKKAFEQLRDMPLLDYLSFIQKLAFANCRSGEGIIYFSDKDLKRLPPAFIESLNDKLSKKKSHVTLSKSPRNISGGFIMSFGDIEENCTFEAILSAKKDELSDIANNVLFVKGGKS